MGPGGLRSRTEPAGGGRRPRALRLFREGKGLRFGPVSVFRDGGRRCGDPLPGRDLPFQQARGDVPFLRLPPVSRNLPPGIGEVLPGRREIVRFRGRVGQLVREIRGQRRLREGPGQRLKDRRRLLPLPLAGEREAGEVEKVIAEVVAVGGNPGKDPPRLVVLLVREEAVPFPQRPVRVRGGRGGRGLSLDQKRQEQKNCGACPQSDARQQKHSGRENGSNPVWYYPGCSPENSRESGGRWRFPSPHTCSSSMTSTRRSRRFCRGSAFPPRRSGRCRPISRTPIPRRRKGSPGCSPATESGWRACTPPSTPTSAPTRRTGGTPSPHRTRRTAGSRSPRPKRPEDGWLDTAAGRS